MAWWYRQYKRSQTPTDRKLYAELSLEVARWVYELRRSQCRRGSGDKLAADRGLLAHRNAGRGACYINHVYGSNSNVSEGRHLYLQIEKTSESAGECGGSGREKA